MSENETVVLDHLGNYFSSAAEMCAHYGVDTKAYKWRIKQGWPIAEALGVQPHERNVHKGGNVTYDHLGNRFESELDMCRAYGISKNMFRHRRAAGKSLSEALRPGSIRGQGAKSGTPVTDPYGRVFESTVQMCEAYGVSRNTYLNRIRRGWSMLAALGGAQKPRKISGRSIEVIDHLGHIHESTVAMCKAYCVGRTTYQARIAKGWTQEEALTGIRKREG